jgi:hypothetical protein
MFIRRRRISNKVCPVETIFLMWKGDAPRPLLVADSDGPGDKWLLAAANV